MTLAFLIYHYFPHGGQQRDFLRIARDCVTRGHHVRVFTLRWEAPLPPEGDGMEVTVLPLKALSRHTLYRRFSQAVQKHLAERPVDCVVGFTRMPGLDVYFGADNCYAEKVKRHRPALYRLTPRYRHFINDERAVFGENSDTRILLLSELQRSGYLRHYPDAAERITLLPPGLDRERKPPADAAAQRRRLRHSLGLSEDDLLILQIGSGYHTKGVDRSLRAIASLPEPRRQSLRYVLVGRGRIGSVSRLARRLGIEEQCLFCGPQENVMPFLCGADMMLHPARTESAGYTLLEGLINGLPLLTSAECGYASHVEQAGAGQVCPAPFRQEDLDRLLECMVESPGQLRQWSDSGLLYGHSADLYRMPQVAADSIEQVAGESGP
ncbi:MAG: glycosyltransferase family 4 protein [Pseudohongiellaceae bacterium]